ncbi:DNA adenine methylase [Runella sp. MFBS21]|uniref:DNA adenine methylase n=1 Tax=Runella sp. MFBS21 TaxID=3034018 RepID=UPI0023FA3D51|nr:DNA adenine methylase [Runella sp. MFBS21]MDF7817910.1 DNA adenine methylase [Runella sp. MFBS21]
MKPLLKTPITYYGGKQMMLSQILPKIPPHKTYIEPFFGGGAVFWAKEPSQAEVINDLNHSLITFYKVLKYDFEGLKEKIDETFLSRTQHTKAKEIYVLGDENPLEVAWSVWVQTNMSFGSMIGAGFGYDRNGKCSLRLFNKKEALTEIYKERLKKVTIENNDVFKVIKAYDSPDAFFYFDPPYVSANQGHYSGYTEAHFRKLLEACANLEGKFLLSTYPETLLFEYIEKYGWKHEKHEKSLPVECRRNKNRRKVECLTWNY